MGNYNSQLALKSAFIACLYVTNTVSQAADYIEDENVSAESVEETPEPFEKGLKVDEEQPVKPKPWSKLPAFIKDASLTAHIRAYDFSRNSEPDPFSDSDATSLGGEIRFKSGLINNMFSVGASYYNSHGIHDEEGGDTLLLSPEGDDLNTLGQLYLEGKIDRYTTRLFRHTFNLPYLNKQDSRMIPNTHEAYTIYFGGDNLQYIAGHVSQIKLRNSESFISMAEAAGAKNSGKGTFMAGAHYNFSEHTNFGALNLSTEDVFNIFYSDFHFTTKLTEKFSSKVALQFTHQKSIGDELIGNFDTNNYGIQIRTSYKNAILTLAASNTGSGSNIISPFGGRPGFLSLMIQDFDMANQQGLLAGLSYDFSRLGLPGLSSFAKYATGKNAIIASSGEDIPDSTEYNFTLDYKPQNNFLKGIWLRLRRARADFDGGTSLEDTRLIVNYEIPIH